MNVVILIFVTLVVMILFLGIIFFAMGGNSHRKYGVKLMWMRVGVQAIVVALVTLGIALG